jgi:hypothetical protein
VIKSTRMNLFLMGSEILALEMIIEPALRVGAHTSLRRQFYPLLYGWLTGVRTRCAAVRPVGNYSRPL